MHYKLLVTMERARTTTEARWQVYSALSMDGFLCDPTVRWSGGIADWFVIGGRFTGELSDVGPGEFIERNRHWKLGYSDDALLLTAALYDRFLAEHEGVEDERAYIDLEGQPLSREFIGRKWLVIVDYHV